MKTFLLWEWGATARRTDLWTKLVNEDTRLHWSTYRQDIAILEFCKKNGCEFVVLNAAGLKIDYIVDKNGGREYKNYYDYDRINTIELRFESDEDALIFKLKYA
jgi:hypothetical protein